MKKNTTESIQSLMSIVQRSMDELEINLPPNELEKISFLLYYSLKPHSRYFHSIKHAIDLTLEGDPLVSLAALFHDLIYYNSDGGFHSLVKPFIEDIIIETLPKENTMGTISLRENIDLNDPLLAINLSIFELKPGQQLNIFGGLNEFLSSIVMTYTFKEILSLSQLTKMIIFLEGTIPFRGRDEQGLGPFDRLFNRYTEVNERFKLGETLSSIKNTIKDGVLFAYRDVSNFAEPDTRDFLDNTWDLIPETNLSLRHAEIYTIKDYRIAIQKMNGFFSFLNPKTIYHQFENTPTDHDLNTLNERALSNIKVAKEYLSIKLITASILEAFAFETGGDCPICYFMGDLIKENEVAKRLENFLPSVDESARSKLNEKVWQLLDTGRNKENEFDIKNAPLSLLVYSSCTQEELSQLSEATTALHSEKIGPKDFILCIPLALREIIGKAIMEMAYSRRGSLDLLLEELR